MFSSRYLRFNNGQKKCIDVLWPVQVFRVIYPDHQDRKLNLFQEAILGLYRAGCTDLTEISQLLDLDKELVLFITGTQLIPNGWLDSSGEITPDGKCILDGNCREKGLLYSTDTSSTPKRKIGYIFWDVINETWMPRFVTELNEIEAQEYNSNGYPVFITERQKNRKIIPYRLKDKFRKAPIPDPKDLLQAYRTYRLDIHHSKQLDNYDDKVDGKNIYLERFDFISDDPEPMYLWTSIFINKNNDDPWSIADPFCIRTAVRWMRKPLLHILDNEKGLAKQIGSLIGKPQAEKQSHAEWLTTLNQTISFDLWVDYPYLEKHTNISRYFTSIKRLQFQINEGNDNSETLDSLYSESQKLIESVLKWMLGTWSVDLKRLPKEREKVSQSDLSKIYSSLNLVFLDDELIASLSRQPWRTIRQSLYYKIESRSSLKGLLAGVLLSIVENKTHPLLHVSPDSLELSKLFKLADLRNKSSHASEHKQDKQEVINLSQFALSWVINFKEQL